MIVILLLFVTSVSALLQCFPGNYLSAGECFPCPVLKTTYNDSALSVSECFCGGNSFGQSGAAGACSACPSGYVRSWGGHGWGDSTIGDCSCPDGMYGDASVPDTCAPCNVTTSDVASVGAKIYTECSITSCRAGRYDMDYGGLVCGGECGSGTYSLSGGNLKDMNDTCISCYPNSEMTTTGNSYCNCSAGSYWATPGVVDTCKLCPEDTWQADLGKTYCNYCHGNSTTDGGTGQIALSSCECIAGFYEFAVSDCRGCQVDKYSDAVGNTCTDCGANFTTNGLTTQTACMCKAGYGGSWATDCVKCDEDSYKTDAGDASCLGCGANATTIGGIGATACVCKAGYQGSGVACDFCPADTFKSTAVDGACSPCGASGTSVEGSTSCVCATGYYFNDTCMQCPESYTTTDGPNKFSIDDCKCEMGYTGAPGSCTICDANNYKDAVGPGACDACAEFYFSPAGSTSISACVYIPVCFGMVEGVDATCSNHGTCEDNVCNCADGWTHPNCSMIACNGVAQNETALVCSGQGTCNDDHSCSCVDGWKGSVCNEEDLFLNTPEIASIIIVSCISLFVVVIVVVAGVAFFLRLKESADEDKKLSKMDNDGIEMKEQLSSKDDKKKKGDKEKTKKKEDKPVEKKKEEKPKPVEKKKEEKSVEKLDLK